jgi:hypothetical protein
MFFTNDSTDILSMSFNMDGQCGDETTFSVNITYPNEYTSTFSIQLTTIEMTLDSNSQSISFVNDINSVCDSIAVKNNDSMKQQIDIMVLFLLILVSLIMNIV